MDNNDIILGSIKGCGSGIRKTYEESFFLKIDRYNYYRSNFMEYLDNKEFDAYYDTNMKSVLFCDKDDKKSYYKKLEVLSILPNTEDNDAYIVELIDAEILHMHLLDERLLLERIASGLDLKHTL